MSKDMTRQLPGIGISNRRQFTKTVMAASAAVATAPVIQGGQNKKGSRQRSVGQRANH